MTKFILTIISITLSVGGYCQNLKTEKLLFTIVKSSLKADVYYYLDFKKDEIPEAKIVVHKDILPLENIESDLTNYSNLRFASKKLHFKELSDSGAISNYILFYSDLIDRSVIIEVLFNRKIYFNPSKKTDYYSWRHQNAGVRYHFIFSARGELINILKKGISYD